MDVVPSGGSTPRATCSVAQVHFKLLQTTCNTASNVNAARTVIRLCYLGNDKNTNLYMLSNSHPLEKKKNPWDPQVAEAVRGQRRHGGLRAAPATALAAGENSGSRWSPVPAAASRGSRETKHRPATCLVVGSQTHLENLSAGQVPRPLFGNWSGGGVCPARGSVRTIAVTGAGAGPAEATAGAT